MFLSKYRANADDRSVFGDFWFTPTGRTVAGQPVSPERAMMLPVVLSCVRVLAESMAVLPPKIYQTGGQFDKLLKKHWLYDLLRAPNEFQTPFEWTEMVQGHLALRGNAFNRIVSGRGGKIKALIPLHPDRIQILPLAGDGDLNRKYRYTDQQGVQKTLTRGEIWHLRGLSSDGVTGLSPIGLARESVALGLAAQDYGARFFQNDAKPGGGWIEHPHNFKDKAQRDAFRESFQEAQSGINRGKTAVLEYGMKYHELGLTNEESQFLEARQFQVTDIARIFRIPPHMIGDLSKATFTNIEQQSLDFVTNTMLAWARRWESSIESNLLTEDEPNICVKFDFTALLRGDQAARSAFYHNGILDGWMTRNEARASEGREPLEGLDEPLRPLNMVEESEAENAGSGDVTTAPEPNPGDDPPNNDARRLQSLLAENARRMAKRIAGGGSLSAQVLADALAVQIERAIDWQQATAGLGFTEDEITASLLKLGA
jgi:HK97 family phage portal protein